MEDEYVTLSVHLTATVYQSGVSLVEVPKEIFDKGKKAIDEFLSEAEFDDISWDCSDDGDIEIYGWEEY